MKSDKEIIKILAEAILYIKPVNRKGKEGFNYNECPLCKGWSYFDDIPPKDHKPECPVLLAEEVLSKFKEEVKYIDCPTCWGEGDIPVREGEDIIYETCPDCHGSSKVIEEEFQYAQLIDTYALCYKCNMIHRKDEKCKIEGCCNHKVELKSFNKHGDITHAYRCEKCFQRFVPIPSDWTTSLFNDNGETIEHGKSFLKTKDLIKYLRNKTGGER